MAHLNSINHCNRTPLPKEVYRDDCNLDDAEAAILTISRYYFQSFAVPESQAWTEAMRFAEAKFGDTLGGIINLRLLKVLLAIRGSRKSVYRFNSTICPTCSGIVTEHERRFIVSLQSLRTQKAGRASSELMMLCEGNDIGPTIDALHELTILLPEKIATDQ